MMSQEKMENPVRDYDQVISYLETNFDEVFGDQVYSEIFPDNECVGEINQNYSKPNAVYLYQDESGKMRRRIMLKDTWNDDFCDYIERNNLALCSGLSYRGRTNKLEHAQRMHAMIFDLDHVGYSELQNLFLRLGRMPDEIRSMPYPTFIATSGSGLHLYYVFEKPIDLYPNIKLQLKAMKYDLTFRLWDYKGTTRCRTVQYQGIAQGFRMIGSVNNKYGSAVRAFQIGGKIPFELLNMFVKEENRVNLQKKYRPTQMSLAKAKDSYPQWYQERIVEGRKKGHWHCKRALYDWWLRKVDEGKIVGGHRYFYLMCLAIYAVKCDVSKTQLKEDMQRVFKKLCSIEHENPFTQRDIESAMEAYDKEYYCFTINDIEKLSGVRIDRNKRNGRKQYVHLMGARAVQEINDKVNGTNWRDGNGRKPKCEIVYEYRKNNPEASVSEVARALRISRPTVYRWWYWEPGLIAKIKMDIQKDYEEELKRKAELEKNLLALQKLYDELRQRKK